MFDVKTVSMEWGGKTLTLETGTLPARLMARCWPPMAKPWCCAP